MKMKILPSVILCVLIAALTGGCGGKEDHGMRSVFHSERIVGEDVRLEDVSEFVYTYENINYNAEYRRYRFWVEDGKYLFFHETRKRENDYGPTTPDDVTASGSVELTAEEWTAFFSTLRGGSVTKRSDGAESGGAGPWTYLYWKNDKDKYQEYEFPSVADRTAFEAFCAALAER